MNSNCPNCYSEKEILDDALDAQKSVTSLYNVFTNEMVHPQLRNTILNILKEEHEIQFNVFDTMQTKGYYSIPAAEQQKIDQTKQTYQAQVNQ